MNEQSKTSLFLVTRPALQAEQFGQALTARFGPLVEVIYSPLLTPRLLDRKLPKQMFEGVIFSSQTGVQAFAQMGVGSCDDGAVRGKCHAFDNRDDGHRAQDFLSCLCTHEKDAASAAACRNDITPRRVAQTSNLFAKACLSPAPHQQTQNDFHHVRRVLSRIRLLQQVAKSRANEDAGRVGMVGPAARNASAFHLWRGSSTTCDTLATLASL